MCEVKKLGPIDKTKKKDDRLQWVTPECELRYRFRGDTSMSMTDMPSPGSSGVRVVWEVVASGGASGPTILRNGKIEISLVTNWTKSPGGLQPEGSLAEIRLRHDGTTWRGVDGPTALWSAFGSFPGLVEFWPALPGTSEPGSRATWELTTHRRGDGARVESTRGRVRVPEGTELPEPVPNTMSGEVELEQWISAQGEPAAVLVARMKKRGEEALGEEIATSYALEQVSRHVVLASGRLLFAEVDRTIDITMPTTGGTMKQTQRMHDEIGLVEACDGPVVDLPQREKASPQEAALATIAAFRNAVGSGTDDDVVARLSPEVVRAHGRESVLRVLRRHVELHGRASLGFVELGAEDVELRGDRVHVKISGS